MKPVQSQNLKPAIPISNKELYDIFTNRVKPEELAKERINEYETGEDGDGNRYST